MYILSFDYRVEAKKRKEDIEYFYSELRDSRLELSKEDEISLTFVVTKMKEYAKLLKLIEISNVNQQRENSLVFVHVLRDFDDFYREVS